MSLGLLAKDSIQDFALLREKEETDSACSNEKVPAVSYGVENQHGAMAGPPLLLEEPLATISGEARLFPPAPATPTNLKTPSKKPQMAANPQQAQEEDADHQSNRLRNTAANVTTLPSYGQYAGFQAGYHRSNSASRNVLSDEDAAHGYTYHDPYAPTIFLERQQQQSVFPNLMCCLFPWLGQTGSQQQAKQIEPGENSADSTDLPSTVKESDGGKSDVQQKSEEEDNNSSASDALGEKLSKKERQAVLARLGLAQPDVGKDSVKGKKGLLNGIPTYDTSPLQHVDEMESEGGMRGQQPRRLKSIMKRGSTSDLKQQSQDPDCRQGGQRRRSLFPSAYDNASSRSTKPLNVTFAPMARVVTVKSKNEMSPDEKADIWWQRSDYEDFRRTGRIITKAMLEGGSEIWLSNQIGNNHSATKQTPPDVSTKENSPSLTATGDKWWHRFGHSRRGLEHVVSIQEGRERQINVRNAIRAVVEEHNRQKALNRIDPEKLRIVALNHTSWARDLALAAGASDADAVVCAFAEDRKSREFYLHKMARSKPNPHRTMPGFMVTQMNGPAIQVRLSSPRQQQRLDANTAAQIRYRRRQAEKQSTSTSTLSSSTELSEPIRDPDPEEKSTESLAHRAAGFMVDGEKVDMAGVLAGMGAIRHEPTAVAT